MKSEKIEIKSNPFIRFIWLTLGLFFTAVGLIGVIIPGLPTTPLMILAAGCFFRSSEKLYNWVLNNKYFGKYVKDFREGRGMPKKAKFMAIGLIWFFVFISIFLGIPEHMFVVKVFTFLGACVGTVIITAIPTYQT